jgi:hypothetical protein
MKAPKGYWKADADARDAFMKLATYINFVDPSVTDEMIASSWALLQKGGLPSGGNGSKDALAIVKQQAEMDPMLKKCHSTLSSGSCKKYIAGEWEEWRRLVCGNSSKGTSCEATAAAKGVAALTGIPVKLYEFLGGEPPWQTSKHVIQHLEKWATDAGGSCKYDPGSTLTVCTGLKSKTHFGRGGTTLGSVLLTDKFPSRRFLDHEAEHMRQWNHYVNQTKFWPTFLVYYLDQPFNECENRYEKQAEAVGKTYYYC